MIKIRFGMIKRMSSRSTYYTRRALIAWLESVGAEPIINQYEDKGRMREGMILSVQEEFETDEQALAWRHLIETTLRKVPERGKIKYRLEIDRS